ncbi:hypothetical protein C8Q77DRAFT_1154138 [Trametes polyzona]|nr:hypothetical protein C8Q77DRAFT_1154138 [Trametes polyzona]
MAARYKDSLLKRALGEAKDLERENETLRMKVIALESKLDRITADDDVLILPRRGNRNRSTIREVKQLKKQVKRLEKSNEKYRKKIHQATVHWLGFLYLITLTMCMQLSMKELENEAEDLVDVAEFEVGDSAHKMRKLLQNFHDLMLANSLEEGEHLICQHTFCDECVRQIQPEPDAETESIRCPQCRGLCPKDEMEVVEFTASEQWDALLDVAKRWAKMDVRREQATTEEEDAEDFIDDDLEGTSRSADGHSLPVDMTLKFHG